MRKTSVLVAATVVAGAIFCATIPYLNEKIEHGGSVRAAKIGTVDETQNCEPPIYGSGIQLEARLGCVKHGEYLVLRVHQTTRWKKLTAPKTRDVPNGTETRALHMKTPQEWNEDALGGEMAWLAANHFLGRHVKTIPFLYVWETVGSGGVLQEKDLVLEIENEPATWDAGYRLVEQNGDALTNTLVLRDGEKLHLTLRAEELLTATQYSVDPESRLVPQVPQNEVGFSSGLPHTLALIDALTTGDLSSGRKVAATGQVNSHGDVWDVSGVTEKAKAAVAAGSDVLFVPSDNHQEAVMAVDGALKVVPVEKVSDAVAWLCAGETKSGACTI